MSGRHADHRRRRGGTPFGPVLPLVTVLLVCLTTAVVVTVGLKQRDAQATADGSLSLSAQQPLMGSVAKKQRKLRGQSATRDASVVSRGASTRSTAEGTTETKDRSR